MIDKIRNFFKKVRSFNLLGYLLSRKIVNLKYEIGIKRDLIKHHDRLIDGARRSINQSVINIADYTREIIILEEDIENLKKTVE